MNPKILGVSLALSAGVLTFAVAMAIANTRGGDSRFDQCMATGEELLATLNKANDTNEGLLETIAKEQATNRTLYETNQKLLTSLEKANARLKEYAR
jgi:hypothetical protein